MKLAAMTSVFPDWDLEKIIDAMQRHGYVGLEPRVGWGHGAGIEPELGPAERDAVRKKLEDAGLAVCCIATGAKLASPDPAAVEASQAEARQGIDLAADVGAPVVRTFGGPRGDGPLNAILHRTAEAYRPLADAAAERGVTVTIETHDDWCVSAQVRALVERIDHPNVRALWDLRHPQRFFERPTESFANLGPITAHVQWSNGAYPDEQSPLQDTRYEDGVLDLATPLRLLRDAGYDGYVSLEIIHKKGTDYDAEGILASYARGFR